MDIGKDLQKAYDEGYEDARVEVAREIFTEIEGLFGQDDEHPFVSCNCDDRQKFEELKRKYTKWQFSEKINYEQPNLTDAKFIDSEGKERGLDEQWERSDELYKKYTLKGHIEEYEHAEDLRERQAYENGDTVGQQIHQYAGHLLGHLLEYIEELQERENENNH